MASNVSFGDDADGGGTMSDINVTPLVDVVLVLLIVFMITVPAIVGSAPVKVNLPQTTSFGGETQELPMNIFIKRHAGGELDWYVNDQEIKPDSFKQKLQGMGVTKDQTVTISADKDIPYQEVIRVMDVLASVGVFKIWLPTQHVNR
jgi:biopolymer transport protein ExbD